ncbi:hypothetical protein KGD82_16395 [Nocardiopsis eucommiae]|uniref:Uncharacterized protein n=1 Tax=Nocardiopsis eucommiae TaxID=2831970 RepID=A0A975LDU2_9ACTN|nr:hypothetical protein KGD82_16395 [Nocardiopsis eucommiae]
MSKDQNSTEAQLAQEVMRLRAELRDARTIPEQIAEAIHADEVKCQEAITEDPVDAGLHGRLVGLQRARDIAMNVSAAAVRKGFERNKAIVDQTPLPGANLSVDEIVAVVRESRGE